MGLRQATGPGQSWQIRPPVPRLERMVAGEARPWLAVNRMPASRPAEEGPEVRLGALGDHDRRHPPIRGAFGRQAGQWFDQLVGPSVVARSASVRRRRTRLASAASAASARPRPPPGVLGVLGERLEGDPADGVIQVQLILERNGISSGSPTINR